METLHRSLRDCNIKRTLFMHKKVENTILQEFPKDINTSLKQVHGKRVNEKEKTTFF